MHFQLVVQNENGHPFISIQLSRVLPNDWAWVNWGQRVGKVNEYLQNNGYLLCVDTAYYDEDTNSQIFELKELEDDEEGNEEI
jgi:hypothetical protein